MNKKQEQEFLLEMQDKQLLENDYELMKKIWKQFDEDPGEKYRDSGKAWQVLKKRIDNDGLMEIGREEILRDRRRQFMRMAATIALILAVGIPGAFFGLRSDNAIEHRSDAGVTTVDLPDGSRVFLNKGASMEYDESFENKRDVKLNGEGYFDVMSDPERPFRVNTGRVIVTVLGTSFNVKETSKRDVEVFVESGSVEVSLADEKIILEPGQLGMATEELKLSEQADANYLSWKTKDFKFVDENLEEILGVLTSAYHVEVDAREVVLDDKRLTTTYNDQSFDAILSTICLAHNLDYEKDGKVYILHSN